MLSNYVDVCEEEFHTHWKSATHTLNGCCSNCLSNWRWSL